MLIFATRLGLLAALLAELSWLFSGPIEANDAAQCIALRLRESSALATLAAQVEPRIKFNTHININKSILSQDGRYVATLSEPSNGKEIVTIQDLATGRVLAQNRFQAVNYLQFVEGTDSLAVNAKMNQFEDPHRLYLMPFSEPARTRTGESNAVMPLESQLTVQGEVKEVGLHLNRGARSTSVTQILARSGLPEVWVIQDGAEFRNLTRFDAKTGQKLGMLEFNKSVPQRAALNPVNDQVALLLVPSVASGEPATVAIVDFRSPGRILHQFKFPKQDPGSIDRNVSMSWSSDGQHLLAYQAEGGSVVDINGGTGEIRSSEPSSSSLGAIEAAVPLRSGENLILRNETASKRFGFYELKGYLIGSHGVDPQGPPDFTQDLDLKAHPNLRGRGEQRFDKNYRRLNGGLPLLEMKGGSKWVIVFPNHLLVIDALPPHKASILSVVGKKSNGTTNQITSFVRVSDHTLRVSDSEHGVVDVDF